MISEKKDGLWDNIRQKKARMKAGSGEKKAKPGDKDYPKTLNVEQSYNDYKNQSGALSFNFMKRIGKGTGTGSRMSLDLGTGSNQTTTLAHKAQSSSVGTGKYKGTEVSSALNRMNVGGDGGWNKDEIAKQVAKERQFSKQGISYSGTTSSQNSQKNKRLSMNNSVEHDDEDTIQEKSAAWQRKEGKNPTGGLNAKGRKSYERENPGSDLKAPQPEGGTRKRSFCARMGGVKGPMKDEKGRPTRKALALRKWKCNETTSLKDELLRKAQEKHKDAKSYKKVMQQGKAAKDKLKDPKGIRGTSKGKWGYYKGGKFRPD